MLCNPEDTLRLALKQPVVAPEIWRRRMSAWSPADAEGMLQLAEQDRCRRLRDIAHSLRRFDLGSARAAANGLADLFEHFGAPQTAALARRMTASLDLALQGFPALENASARALDRLREMLPPPAARTARAA